MKADEKSIETQCYNCGHEGSINSIDIAERMNFNLGVAMTHLWNAALDPEIDPDEALDRLEQASWFIENEIERRRERAGGDDSGENGDGSKYRVFLDEVMFPGFDGSPAMFVVTRPGSGHTVGCPCPKHAGRAQDAPNFVDLLSAYNVKTWIDREALDRVILDPFKMFESTDGSVDDSTDKSEDDQEGEGEDSTHKDSNTLQKVIDLIAKVLSENSDAPEDDEHEFDPCPCSKCELAHRPSSERKGDDQ